MDRIQIRFDQTAGYESPFDDRITRTLEQINSYLRSNSEGSGGDECCTSRFRDDYAEIVGVSCDVADWEERWPAIRSVLEEAGQLHAVEVVAFDSEEAEGEVIWPQDASPGSY